MSGSVDMINYEGYDFQHIQNFRSLIITAIAKKHTLESLLIELNSYTEKKTIELKKRSRIEAKNIKSAKAQGKIYTETKPVDHEKQQKKVKTLERMLHATSVEAFPLCPDCSHQLWPQIVEDEFEGLVMVLNCNKKCRHSQYVGTYEEVLEMYPRFFELRRRLKERFEEEGRL